MVSYASDWAAAESLRPRTCWHNHTLEYRLRPIRIAEAKNRFPLRPAGGRLATEADLVPSASRSHLFSPLRAGHQEVDPDDPVIRTQERECPDQREQRVGARRPEAPASVIFVFFLGNLWSVRRLLGGTLQKSAVWNAGSLMWLSLAASCRIAIGVHEWVVLLGTTLGVAEPRPSDRPPGTAAQTSTVPGCPFDLSVW